VIFTGLQINRGVVKFCGAKRNTENGEEIPPEDSLYPLTRRNSPSQLYVRCEADIVISRNSWTAQGSPGLDCKTGGFTLLAKNIDRLEMHLESAECAGSCRCTSWYARCARARKMRLNHRVVLRRARRACETRFQ